MPKRYTSKELIKIVEADEWYLVNSEGSHHQFRHKTKKGRVTIEHPRKEMLPKTANRILKQAGLKK